WTFLFGSLALAGVIPFAGFWSKDAIIAATHHRAHDATLYLVLYWLALVVAAMTSFYTFRAFFLAFYWPERVPYEAGHHAHESPNAMTVPLMILAVCALGVGAYYQYTGSFDRVLAYTPSLAYEAVPRPHEHDAHAHFMVAVISTVIALAGVGVAAFLYLGDE